MLEDLPPAQRLPPGVRPHNYAQPTAQRRPFTRDHTQRLPPVLLAGAFGPGRVISALCLSSLHTVCIEYCAWRQTRARTPVRICSQNEYPTPCIMLLAGF